MIKRAAVFATWVPPGSYSGHALNTTMPLAMFAGGTLPQFKYGPPVLTTQTDGTYAAPLASVTAP
jgi:hypothetical protein